MVRVFAQEVESFIYPWVPLPRFLSQSCSSKQVTSEAGGMGAFPAPVPPLPGRDLSTQTPFPASAQHTWEEGFLEASG